MANNAINVEIAAIIGWLVRLEKYIPSAQKLPISYIRPKEFPIR